MSPPSHTLRSVYKERAISTLFSKSWQHGIVETIRTFFGCWWLKTQTHLSDCQMENCNVSLHRTHLYFSGVLTTHMHPMLCITLGDVWLECSCLVIETHSMKLSAHCPWANLKATWSLEFWSEFLCRKFANYWNYCVPVSIHWPQFLWTWPPTSCLSFCCSQTLPGFYNPVDSGLWNI